jgi:hypothetical protein
VTLPEHPGTVAYVDAASGEVTRRVAADEVPESIRYAPGPDGRPQPVTRISILTVGDRREIRQFGADGTLLRSTYQRAEPPG